MTAIALVKKVQNLPPVSQAALKLINLLDRASGDNSEIVQVLKYDNVLTAKLLQACNASSFALQEPVSSVDQAVLILGHQQILHIVITLAFKSVMTVSSITNTIEMSELWQHAVVSAIAGEVVVDQAPALDPGTSVGFTASLLHDIGKLVLGLALSPEELSEIRDRAERKQISGSEAEKEVIGTDHAEVGAALLQSWRLPPSIVESVANHHHPVIKPKPQVSALVHVANCVAHHAKPPLGQNIHDLRMADEVVAMFGIKDEKLDQMVLAVRENFDKVDAFMAMT